MSIIYSLNDFLLFIHILLLQTQLFMAFNIQNNCYIFQTFLLIILTNNERRLKPSEGHSGE